MSTPSGWYRAPDDPARQRWWDGEHWTDATRAAPAPVRKRRNGRWWFAVGVLALILLGVASYASNPGTDGMPDASAPSSPPKRPTGPAPTPVPMNAPVAGPQASVAALPTQVLSGAGNAVRHINLQGNKALITFDCATCTGNTILRTNGFDTLLVNVIGSYSGTHLVDTDGTSSTSTLSITADAPWKITISDPGLLPPSAGPVIGHGDQVINLGGGSREAFVTNAGKGAFAVVGIGGPMKDLAVDEVGGYKGVVSLQAPEYVQVESDGTWTLTPQ